MPVLVHPPPSLTPLPWRPAPPPRDPKLDIAGAPVNLPAQYERAWLDWFDAKSNIVFEHVEDRLVLKPGAKHLITYAPFLDLMGHHWLRKLAAAKAEELKDANLEDLEDLDELVEKLGLLEVETLGDEEVLEVLVFLIQLQVLLLFMLLEVVEGLNKDIQQVLVVLQV